MTDQRVTRGTYPKLLSELVCPSCKGRYKIGWYRLDTWHLRGLFLATGVPSPSESNSGIPGASQLRAPTYCNLSHYNIRLYQRYNAWNTISHDLMITLQVSISHAHHVKPSISPLLSEMPHPYKPRNLPNQTPDSLPGSILTPQPGSQRPTQQAYIHAGVRSRIDKPPFLATCDPTIRYNHWLFHRHLVSPHKWILEIL